MTYEEISGKEFSSSLRGLNADEVYDHLDLVAQEWRLLEEEYADATSKIKDLTERVEAYKGRENALQKTLESIEGVRIQAVETAQREGALIRAEAELEADKIVKAAETKKMILCEEIKTLETLYASLRNRFKVVLDTVSDLIKSPEELGEQALSSWRSFSVKPAETRNEAEE